MKKIIYCILSIVVIGCTNGDTALSQGDGQGGSMAIFALKGNYLYCVDDMKLNVFSLINNQQPSKVNEISIGFNIETLFSFDNNLYVGSQRGMYIYSLTNPETPLLLGQAQHFTACDPVVANATHSFVTLSTTRICGNNINLLQVYNTTNPSTPIKIHERTLANPKGLALFNNFLVVCDDDLKFFDITNPTNPVLVKAITKNCFDVIIRGNDLYAVGTNGVYRYLLDNANITNVIFKSEITY